MNIKQIGIISAFIFLFILVFPLLAHYVNWLDGVVSSYWACVVFTSTLTVTAVALACGVAFLCERAR